MKLNLKEILYKSNLLLLFNILCVYFNNPILLDYLSSSYAIPDEDIISFSVNFIRTHFQCKRLWKIKNNLKKSFCQLTEKQIRFSLLNPPNFMIPVLYMSNFFPEVKKGLIPVYNNTLNTDEECNLARDDYCKVIDICFTNYEIVNLNF